MELYTMCTMDDGLFRQRERTIDNIKRIYAVVYSISLTNVLRDIFVYCQSSLADRTSDNFAAGLSLRVVMLVVFTSTISVFAFQADKFLDLRYALRPSPLIPERCQTMPRWRRGDFAWDAISLIVSLVPFTLMSYAFEDEIVRRFGILPFYAAYLLQLGMPLVFLLITRFRHLCAGRGDAAPALPAGHNLSEEARYAVLSFHWFLTNGIVLIALTALYCAIGSFRHFCGTIPPGVFQWTSIILFTLIALARNIYDYLSAWPFLYINTRQVDPVDLTPMMLMIQRHNPQRITVFDLTGLIAVVFVSIAIYNVCATLSPAACPAPAPIPAAASPTAK
jgi:hypothetical protein